MLLTNRPYLMDDGGAVSGLLVRSTDEAGKIHPAQQHPDRRHDDVVHQRRDDLAEGPANDDAHGHIHGIALDGELAELFEQPMIVLPSWSVGGRKRRQL